MEQEAIVDDLKTENVKFNVISSRNTTQSAGDYNINLTKLNENELLTSHSTCPQITLPTRVSERHGTFIDNLFCKLTKTILENRAGILIKQC